VAIPKGALRWPALLRAVLWAARCGPPANGCRSAPGRHDVPGRQGRLASEQLERLARMPFTVGAAALASTHFLLGYGSVLEAYWLPGPGSRAVIEKGDVQTFIRIGD